jgi:hypothetical protein
LRDLATGIVISLEPRTPHQPGKLQKLSKNEFVLLLPCQESTKFAKLYVLVQQASAGSSQAGGAKMVQRTARAGEIVKIWQGFPG